MCLTTETAKCLEMDVPKEATELRLQPSGEFVENNNNKGCFHSRHLIIGYLNSK